MTTPTDPLREALAELVRCSPDPEFVRNAALEDDSDPASMIEEGARCYRQALDRARSLLASSPSEETPQPAGPQRSDSMNARNMYGCLPCPRCGSVYRVPIYEKGCPVIACDDCGRRASWDGKWGEDGYSVNEADPAPSPRSPEAAGPCSTPTLRAPGLNGDESAYDHDAPEFCICGVRMDLHYAALVPEPLRDYVIAALAMLARGDCTDDDLRVTIAGKARAQYDRMRAPAPSPDDGAEIWARAIDAAASLARDPVDWAPIGYQERMARALRHLAPEWIPDREEELTR